MKVLIAYITTISDDPNMSAEVINGYELHGGTWDGEIDIEENVLETDITAEYLQSKVDAGYEMIIRNTISANDEGNLYSRFSDALNQGLLCVVPVGSNQYQKNFSYFENFFPLVRCGSGQRGLGNATAYPCMFLDQAIESEPILDIEYMFPCGTSYTISEVFRVNSTTLSFKLSGVTDVRDVGFFDHGIPFVIDSLSGSDISPLPSGFFATGGVATDGSSFFITVPATTGSSGWQSVTGSLTYGNDTKDVAIVKVPTYQPLSVTGNAVVLDNINGFEFNPNGVTEIYEPLNYDGFGDKLKIAAELGEGTYAGGGTASLPSQSYATPYIAGQLAWIKYRMGSGWYDVVGRAMKTGSRYASEGYTYLNGYGYINGDEAVLCTDRSLEAPVVVDISVNYYTFKMKWNPIPFAEQYEVFYKGELVYTLDAHITEFANGFTNTISSLRETKGQRRLFKVRAKRGNDYSDFSNELEFNFYCNGGILAKEVAV